MSNKKQNFGGPGYYIALGLCAVAIAFCGWLYTLGRQDPPEENPHQTVSGTVGKDVPVIGTEPQVTYPVEDLPVSGDLTEPAEQEHMQTVYPVEGQTVAVFSMDALTYNPTTRDWRTHDGVDITAEAGSTVCAAAAGTVYSVYDDATMGTTVVIRHAQGYTTEYASLAKDVAVEPGQTVQMGQTIGTVGSTALLESALGDHVHFSVTRDGEAVDPMEFLNPDE